MTREHKLALIIGFTLVLVVGVLISDHFSKAHEARVKSELPEKPARNLATEGLRPVGGGTGNAGAGGGGGGSIFGPRSAVAGTMPQAGPDSALPPIHDPTIVDSGAMGEGERTIVMGSRFSTPPEETGGIAVQIPRGFEPLGPGSTLMQGSTRPIDETMPAPDHQQRPSGPDGVRVVVPTGPTIQPPAPGVPRTGTPAPLPGNPPAEELINDVPLRMCARHDVREGESLYGIAKSKYGDGTLWEKLRDFNKGKVSANGSMREGVTLLIPPKEALTGKPLPTMPQAPPTPLGTPGKIEPKKKIDPAGGDTAVAKSQGAAMPRTYTVQKGDVLSEVSRKMLGTSRRWMEIQSLNNDVLDDGDSLVVGMVLKLPVR